MDAEDYKHAQQALIRMAEELGQLALACMPTLPPEMKARIMAAREHRDYRLCFIVRLFPLQVECVLEPLRMGESLIPVFVVNDVAIHNAEGKPALVN